MNKILSLNDNIYINLDKADKHVRIMMDASNLLIDKGGFSCIGSLVSTGNLFATKQFNQYIKHPTWQSYNKKYTLID